MKWMFRRVPEILVTLMLMVGSAHAAETPADGDLRQPGLKVDPLDQAPAEIREFLIKAEVADRIADPLARCLAFPDLPGNRWPEGLAAAHCRLHFGPRIRLAQVQRLVEQGAFAELDAMFAADLALHFSTTDFSEAIHGDFDDFDGSYESGRLTQRWLEHAPDSPYALTARAVHYRNLAHDARGAKWASQTPRENFARMGEFSDLAVDLYQRALKIEPRLMPAYIGLLDIGTMDSRADLKQWAIEAANRIDPACKSVSGFQMISLTPRWGGNYPAMRQLAATLTPKLRERPLLGLNTEWTDVDRGTVAYDEDRYREAIDILGKVTVMTSHSRPHESLASALMALDQGSWPALMHFVAASRYWEGSSWVARARARLLLYVAQRPDWARRHLEVAVRKDPDNSFGHFLLATANYQSGRFAEAEPGFLIAMEDPSRRQSSLIGLTRALASRGLFAKALPYMDQYSHEYPDDPMGWLLRVQLLDTSGDLTAHRLDDMIRSAERFLAGTTKSVDAWTVDQRKLVSEGLQAMRLYRDGADVAR